MTPRPNVPISPDDLLPDQRNRVGYIKALLFAGPRDGHECFVTVPPPLELLPYAKDAEGRQWRARYRRRPGELGDILTFAQWELDEHSQAGPLTNFLATVFSGKRPIVYDCLDHAPRTLPEPDEANEDQD